MGRKGGLATTEPKAERRAAGPTHISLSVVCEDVTRPEKPEEKTVVTLFCWTEVPVYFLAVCFFGLAPSARWHCAGPPCQPLVGKRGRACVGAGWARPKLCGILTCFFNLWGCGSETLDPETTDGQDLSLPLKKFALWVNTVWVLLRKLLISLCSLNVFVVVVVVG